MKTLSSLKKDLEFNRGLSSLIEVLKTIAVAQYRVLEQRIKSHEKLILTIESFLELIDTKKIRHPFINPGDRPQAVIAITSDSGLLGGLNMQVIAHSLSEIEKSGGKIIVVGERGKSYVQESKIPFVAFSGIKDEERYEQAMQLRDYCIDKVLAGSIGAVKIVYPHPVSFTIQRVETVTFIPFEPRPVKSGYSPPVGPDIILESSPGDIIEYLGSLWLGQKLHEIFGLSRLSEFAARFVHLEGSHQRLKDMDGKIRLEYFRVRHELIDRNMRELFAARLLYAG
jgi:ATP synthase F1 gamma subunit